MEERLLYPTEHHDISKIIFWKDDSRLDHRFLHIFHLGVDFIHIRELCWVPNKFLCAIPIVDLVWYSGCSDDDVGVVFLVT